MRHFTMCNTHFRLMVKVTGLLARFLHQLLRMLSNVVCIVFRDQFLSTVNKILEGIVEKAV